MLSLLPTTIIKTNLFVSLYKTRISALVITHLSLYIEMEAPPPGSVLQHDASLVLSIHKEGWSLHFGECELEIVVEVVKVEEEVPDTSAKGQNEVLIATVSGELDKILAHPLIELLVLEAEDLHRCLSHLAELGLRVCLIGHKICLQVNLLFYLLPHIVAKLINYLLIKSFFDWRLRPY